MNIEEFKKEIEIDEGCKYEIYLDHLNLPTFGIGHLILDSDPESGEEVGTPVSEDRVSECFNKDVHTVLSDCEKLYEDFYTLPEEVQRIIANMMFNMGYPRLSKFKGMKLALMLVIGNRLQTRWLTLAGIIKLLTELKDWLRG